MPTISKSKGKENPEGKSSPTIAGDTGYADGRNFEDDCIASLSDNDSNDIDNAKPGTLTLNQ